MAEKRIAKTADRVIETYLDHMNLVVGIILVLLAVFSFGSVWFFDQVSLSSLPLWAWCILPALILITAVIIIRERQERRKR